MTSIYSLHPARPQDLAPLPALERAAAALLAGHAPPEILEETTDAATFAEAQQAGRLWVMSCNETPVGFALVKLLADGAPHLQEIDVHPDHGWQGLGAKLLAAVCEWARDAGHASLTLTTFDHLPWNGPFYQRLGFNVLAPDELTPELREILSEEAARGLDARHRVAMRLPLLAKR